MIKPDQFNCITVASEATPQKWMGFFVGVPYKEDILAAIEHTIDRLVDGEVEHEQDEVDAYRIALQVVYASDFNRVDEDVSVARIRIGSIKCERMECFNVTQQPLRCA